MDQPAPALTADSGEVTDLLLQSCQGDPGATDRLFPLVYEELRRVAHAQLRSERPGHTLGTTALVHETYLRLVDQTRAQWRDRGHFLVVASWAMRRILLDYARRNRAVRRGGGTVRFTFDADAPAAERGEMLLALDEALERLAHLDRRSARWSSAATSVGSPNRRRPRRWASLAGRCNEIGPRHGAGCVWSSTGDARAAGRNLPMSGGCRPVARRGAGRRSGARSRGHGLARLPRASLLRRPGAAGRGRAPARGDPARRRFSRAARGRRCCAAGLVDRRERNLRR